MICDECGFESDHVFCFECMEDVPPEETLADADPGLLL